MATIKVLSYKKEKELAFIEVQGTATELGFIPTKSGLIRAGKDFKLAKGDVKEDKAIDYDKVRTRESHAIIDNQPVVFTWLLW